MLTDQGNVDNPLMRLFPVYSSLYQADNLSKSSQEVMTRKYIYWERLGDCTVALECHACMPLYLYEFCSARHGQCQSLWNPLPHHSYSLSADSCILEYRTHLPQRQKQIKENRWEVEIYSKIWPHDYRGIEVLRSVVGTLQTQEPERRALARVGRPEIQEHGSLEKKSWDPIWGSVLAPYERLKKAIFRLLVKEEVAHSISRGLASFLYAFTCMEEARLHQRQQCA